MAGYSTPAWANNTAPAISASNLKAMGNAIELAQHPYGVCSTAADSAGKTVSIDYSVALTLFTGLTVRVKFTNGNTAANPTLNVNATGAIPIMSYGTTAASTWEAGQILTLTYDGTNWLQSAPSLKIGTGSYVGTGTWGETNKTTIDFGFTPVVVAVLIQKSNSDNTKPRQLMWDFYQENDVAFDYGTAILFRGQDVCTQAANWSCRVEWSGTTVSFYSTQSGAGARTQFNDNGKTYFWYAIGY
jgi:hypothetical protein